MPLSVLPKMRSNAPDLRPWHLGGWGEGAPCFTRLAVGRPAEQMGCAGLLNVASVDGAGRPGQRSTITRSQTHRLTGPFISHHRILWPCVLLPAKTRTFNPQHAGGSLLFPF